MIKLGKTFRSYEKGGVVVDSSLGIQPSYVGIAADNSELPLAEAFSNLEEAKSKLKASNAALKPDKFLPQEFLKTAGSQYAKEAQDLLDSFTKTYNEDPYNTQALTTYGNKLIKLQTLDPRLAISKQSKETYNKEQENLRSTGAGSQTWSDDDGNLFIDAKDKEGESNLVKVRFGVVDGRSLLIGNDSSIYDPEKYKPLTRAEINTIDANKTEYGGVYNPSYSGAFITIDDVKNKNFESTLKSVGYDSNSASFLGKMYNMSASNPLSADVVNALNHSSNKTNLPKLLQTVTSYEFSQQELKAARHEMVTSGQPQVFINQSFKELQAIQGNLEKLIKDKKITAPETIQAAREFAKLNASLNNDLANGTRLNEQGYLRMILAKKALGMSTVENTHTASIVSAGDESEYLKNKEGKFVKSTEQKTSVPIWASPMKEEDYYEATENNFSSAGETFSTIGKIESKNNLAAGRKEGIKFSEDVKVRIKDPYDEKIFKSETVTVGAKLTDFYKNTGYSLPGGRTIASIRASLTGEKAKYKSVFDKAVIRLDPGSEQIEAAGEPTLRRNGPRGPEYFTLNQATNQIGEEPIDARSFGFKVKSNEIVQSAKIVIAPDEKGGANKNPFLEFVSNFIEQNSTTGNKLGLAIFRTDPEGSLAKFRDYLYAQGDSSSVMNRMSIVLRNSKNEDVGLVQGNDSLDPATKKAKDALVKQYFNKMYTSFATMLKGGRNIVGLRTNSFLYFTDPGNLRNDSNFPSELKTSLNIDSDLKPIEDEAEKVANGFLETDTVYKVPLVGTSFAQENDIIDFAQPVSSAQQIVNNRKDSKGR